MIKKATELKAGDVVVWKETARDAIVRDITVQETFNGYVYDIQFIHNSYTENKTYSGDAEFEIAEISFKGAVQVIRYNYDRMNENIHNLAELEMRLELIEDLEAYKKPNGAQRTAGALKRLLNIK